MRYIKCKAHKNQQDNGGEETFANEYNLDFKRNTLIMSFEIISGEHSVQGRTGHSSYAKLVAGAFTISHTKCQKRGLLKLFFGPFEFFCMDGHRVRL
jgi:hypothetical protein